MRRRDHVRDDGAHLEILTRDRPREFAVRTMSGPTPLLHRYRFAAVDGGAEIAPAAQDGVEG